ncbi:MAG: hypothetical protein EZS28_000838 [Streblomastix strix]|uniref:Uncharacterized protein n=1 Tax=Streblomastix strix TaxID=222440 RepID=A0A5J4X9S1_9EUKA|nr:MAG: hypothetical protein EZS28_000838 [Streblomastix strix]
MPIVDETTRPKEQYDVINESYTTRSHKKYSINKYQEVDRTTAQIEPEETINQLAEEQPKLQYLSHLNLIVQKFDIDTILRTITHRQRGDDFIFSSDNFIKFWCLITQNDEQDVEIVLEEAIIKPHTFMPRKYKKRFGQSIGYFNQNISVKIVDNVLNNSIEKQY